MGLEASRVVGGTPERAVRRRRSRRSDAAEPASARDVGERVFRPCHAVLCNRVRACASGRRCATACQRAYRLLPDRPHDLSRRCRVAYPQAGSGELLCGGCELASSVAQGRRTV